jgi:hypothetical protein
MKKERTIKELLQLMLEHQELFESGLCNWIFELRYQKIINIEERTSLHRFIKENRPSKYSSIDAFKHRDRMYYWERNNIKPRIKWLKKHIARL